MCCRAFRTQKRDIMWMAGIQAGVRLMPSDHHSGVITYKSKDLKTWAGPYLVFEVPNGSWADPETARKQR